MKKKISILLFFLIGSLRVFGQEYLLKDSVLKPITPGCIDKIVNESYLEIQGLKISSFYKIIDSLNMDFNGDRIPDKIPVLSPITQEISDSILCVTERKKRLLIGLLSTKNKKFDVGFINENAVLNLYDYMSDPLRRLQKIKNGIRLRFDFGSIVSCQYEFDFIIKGGALVLNKRSYWFFNKSNPDLEKHKTVYFKAKKYYLKNIDINKFLVEIPDLIQ